MTAMEKSTLSPRRSYDDSTLAILRGDVRSAEIAPGSPYGLNDPVRRLHHASSARGDRTLSTLWCIWRTVWQTYYRTNW
jgi:hypothetical protein